MSTLESVTVQLLQGSGPGVNAPGPLGTKTQPAGQAGAPPGPPGRKQLVPLGAGQITVAAAQQQPVEHI